MTANNSLTIASPEELNAPVVSSNRKFLENGVNKSNSAYCCDASVDIKPMKLQHPIEEQLREKSYCERCSAQGLIFYMNDRYTWKSKCMRATIVVLATLCTFYVCHLSSQRFFYSYSWVQTVIGRTDMHVSEIPFPAITICPIRNINFSLVEEVKHKIFGDNYTTVTNAELQLFLETIQQVLQPPDDMKINYDSLSMYGRELKGLMSNQAKIFAATKFKELREIPISTILHLIPYECEELFSECFWRRVRIPCCDIFRKIQSFKGLCYSFNSMKVKNAIDTWPWMVPSSGYGAGLQVYLKPISSDEHFRTHVVMIHGPYEELASESIYLNAERAVVAISPLRYTAESDIVSLSPDVRHCFFTHELRKKKETQSSCLINCRLKHLEKHCNCTYFIADWISEKKKNSPICGAAHLECIYENRLPLLTTSNFFEEVSQDKITIHNCGCYPNCNYVDYRTSVHMDNTGAIKCRNKACLRELLINYQDDTFLSYHSMKRFTLLDLVVAFGGIAGLFLGLSFVGIFDGLQQIITILFAGMCIKKSKEEHHEKCIKA